MAVLADIEEILTNHLMRFIVDLLNVNGLQAAAAVIDAELKRSIVLVEPYSALIIGSILLLPGACFMSFAVFIECNISIRNSVIIYNAVLYHTRNSIIDMNKGLVSDAVIYFHIQIR